MIKLEAGEKIGAYRVTDFLARGGFSLVYLAEDDAGQKVALKIGDVAGGGRYVTRFLEITNRRQAEGISPDETPAEAIFGSVDAGKLRSSATLFAAVPGAPDVFDRILRGFFEGRPCRLTLERVG